MTNQEHKEENHGGHDGHANASHATKTPSAEGHAATPVEINAADLEHMKKAILIEKYSPLYDGHFGMPSLKAWIHSITGHHHHQAIIDVSQVKSPTADTLSKEDKIERTTYALWKIRQVNHHFFAPSEADTIDNRPLRIARYTLLYSGMVGITGYLGFNLLKNRLSIVKCGRALGAYFLLKGTMYGMEVFYDKVKMIGRKQLAKKYMLAYGDDAFVAMCSPSYPINELAHLHNKLH